MNVRRKLLKLRAYLRQLGAVLITATMALAIAALASSPTATAASVAIPSPVAGGWQLNGSAVLNTTASPPNLELTPATSWVEGSAFYPTAVPGAGISASFDVFLGSGSGADGLTFVLADASVTKPTALGATGGGEGFSGITGIAVSFDTYQNAPDPSNNFVGIATTNTAQEQLNYVATNTSIPALRNVVHHVTVTTSSTGIVVTMDGTQVLSYATSLPPQVLVGFTGATGGLNDIHQVQNVNITTGPPPAAPAVTGVSPASGPAAGGTSVTIAGTALTGASSVMFGSTAATGFTVNSDTSITATSPPGSGTVDVTVTTAGGPSATSSADKFTYIPPPPTVTNISPGGGPAGSTVTVTGTNFTGATAVDFGSGNAATFTVNNSTTITATAPAGTGTVDVTVTTPSGTSATSSADQFTYGSGPPPVTIPSPVAGGWQLNGSAVLNTTASPPNLELTPATSWDAGSAFWPKPVTGVGISASFDVFLGGGSGADGLTFVLADASVTKPTALGQPGGGEGFSGITGIAVSFDTYQNAPDPSNNFVGIATTNAPGGQLNYVATNTSIPALRNVVHHVTVTTSSTGIVVTMDGTQVLSYATSLPSQVLVGFTGACGGGTDIHKVQNVVITAGPPPPPPTVSSVTPNKGPTTGGTQVTIAGANLSGATGVQFGTAAAINVTVTGSTSITATAPAGSGTVDVTVTTAGGVSATSTADQFTYVVPPPTVTGVSPASGPAGTSVTVTGTNFTGTTGVSFGSTAATFTVTNATTITATAPAGTGTVDVTVKTPSGTSATGTPDQFTYTVSAPAVTGVSPSSGPAGTTVTVSGTNFTGATAVDFGSGNAATFTVTNATTITATAPAGTGTVDVTVTTPSGTSATGTPDQFTYGTAPSPPAVSGVSPSSGPAGTTVTVSGTNFTGATAVDFGSGNAATFTVTNATTITATAPAGTGTVDVTVTTPGGTSATGTADQFTYAAPSPPAVNGVSPSSGPAGTTVTVSGTNFTGATAVDFGSGNAATFTVTNSTTITATVPAGTGTVNVTVTTPSGTSATSSADQFTYGSGLAIPSPLAGGWQLNGSAVLNTTASPPNLELTPATQWMAGSAFYPTPVTAVGMSATFDVFLGSGTGADGMTFVLADASVTKPTALGNAGGGEGFSGITGVAVSFDTYQNAPDPSNNFVGIATTNTPQGQLNYVDTNTNIPALRNVVHHVTVTTSTTGIVVTMDGTQVLNYATSLPPKVLVGFTGATGGGADIHQVQNVTITTAPPPPAPTVTSVTPPSGPTTGGTQVTIGGTSLSGASGVQFGSTAATSFTVNSATSITATAPAGQAGAVDVTVVGPGGTSATSSADQFTYTPPPPTVSFVQPGSGPGGSVITISGTNFTGVTGVQFGGTAAASFTVNNATTITATAPAGTGTVDVTVTTTGGTSATSSDDQFTFGSGPPPNQIPSPDSGGWQLNGSAVLNTTASPPNLELTPATSWDAGSAFYPTATPGVGIQASFDIFLGGGSGADGLTFVLADASVTKPTALGQPGGGEGFSGITGIAVSFDTYQNAPDPSNNFVGIATTNAPQGQLNYVTTDTAIPALRNTMHHVVVTTDATGISVTMDGEQVLTDTITLPSQVLVGFTGGTGGGADIHEVQNVIITTGGHVPPPTVASISPTSGSATGGTQVTISGTDLTGTTSVHFGSNLATAVSVNNATNITATAPAGQVGTVDVTVTTIGGTSQTSAQDQYTYITPPVPTVTGVSPNSGPTTGGTSVTITGAGFLGATAVDFGSNNSATFTVANDTTITATAPPNATLTTVDITVTTPGGTNTTTSSDHFTYVPPPPPTITSVSPYAGPAGTPVAIIGTNFSGATTVDFGGVSSTFSVTSPTQIMATAPASSATGAVDVTVTTLGGTSATTSADQFTYQSSALPVTEVATYRNGPDRTGYYPAETGINAANVATLKIHWATTTGGGPGAYTQPIVANNMVYWGDWNGVEHATTLTGQDVWTFPTGTNTDLNCQPQEAGISGTSTIGTIGNTSVDWFPGGDDVFYAVNASTGALMWKTTLGTRPADFLWASPILYNGNLYEGVASYGDCPLVNGRIVEMNPATGAIEHLTYIEQNGCLGGGIWASPTIDTSDGSMYLATGTPGGCAGEIPPGIIKLRASDLTILSSWTLPASAQTAGDADFGSTPVLFTATINGVARSLVGALNKNGVFYAWDRTNLAAGPVWQAVVADPEGSPRSVASAAWDGTQLYVAAGPVAALGATCNGNVSALNPATGAIIWQTCVNGFMPGGVTVVPGLVIESYGPGYLQFFNSANGSTVRLMSNPARFDGELTPSNGILYGVGADGELYAFGQ